jgi:hypothetical protein
LGGWVSGSRFQDFASLGIVVLEFGKLGLTGGKTTMSKEAPTAVVLDHEAQKKFDECVAALTVLRYGPQGPPKDTTFAGIEAFGHEVGRMLGRAVDEQLASRHAEQFQQTATCPNCQTVCEPKPTPLERQIQTTDGLVPIHEPVCRCSVCNRDFFPSAYRVED